MANSSTLSSWFSSSALQIHVEVFGLTHLRSASSAVYTNLTITSTYGGGQTATGKVVKGVPNGT